MIFHSSRTIHLFFYLSISFLSASTGKISGKITDKDSGDPMIGVNVLIKEIGTGSVSDNEGEYTISNIPPGMYTVEATYIGYSKFILKEIQINQGRTSYQNISLTSEAIEAKEVVVTADRPMVHKDLTASQRITTAKEIADLPVESFIGVLVNQAGVNQGAGGEIHIRGGRYNEVGYYIDGVSVSNPFFTNSLAVNISNKSLQEMRVVSGAFNAEYGNAMSGIVNIELKEGDAKKTSGSLSMYSGDYLTNNEQIFENINQFDPISNTIIDAGLNGPLSLISPEGKLTYNVSTRYSNQGGYLYGLKEHEPDDIADFRFTDSWYIEMGGDSSYVSMNPSNRVNTLAKITYKFNPKLKISIQDILNTSKWKSYVHSYKYNPDGTYNYKSKNRNTSIKLNRAFNKSFFTLNIFHNSTSYNSFVYEDPYDSRYVSTSLIRGTPPSPSFSFGGTQMGHNERTSYSNGGKFDVTIMNIKRHDIKFGLSGRADHLKEDAFTILYDEFNYPNPTVLEANESPSHSLYKKKAIFFSSYLQDKIEYEDMVINVGMRYDQFNPDDKYISDLVNPEGERIKAENKNMYSPRFGISFPITEKGIVHFSYGHFYQMPTLRNLYKTSIFGANRSPTVGYANLNPEKTVQYEFGLQQQLSQFIAFDMSIYYKDVRDLLALQSISYDSPKYGPSSYSVYLNKDYAAVKGMTFSLTKRYDPITRITAFFDYGFQISEGNSVTSGSFYFNTLTGIQEEKKVVPLSWDQRHIINTTVTYNHFNKWGVSFIGKLSSGWPYTPNIPLANYVPEPNSDRKPWQKNINARLFKKIAIGRHSLIVFAKIYNLLDTLNEKYVYNDTGRSGYTFINRSSQETETLTKHYGEPGVHTWEEYHNRPDYYSSPRELQIGFSIEINDIN
tara:strand:+ start:58 stop:2748 length:2691 start_codon:yes stop_codon:yes gene_type:complete